MLAPHGELALPSVPDFRPIVGIAHGRSSTFVGFKLPFVRLSRLQGFTLIELMIALLVLSILAFVAVPSIQPLILRNRLTTETNRLIGDLAYARSEAILRSANVAICTSDNRSTCDGSANWTKPLLVFVDANLDNTRDPMDPNEPVLRAGEAATAGVSITPTSIPHPLVFTARGTSRDTIAAGATLAISVSGLSENRKICFSAIGQEQVRRDSSNCP